ncbi:DUF1810 domain-containing protein [Novosphingobium sp. 9U]|uniref:DUF1810 domain-containing protein n=1 Tax=Novosphingobium sp. 9U TaxID=2653158 RepID=UPI0012EEE75D|nr:DUF1810 domain-containing protein [Novosphingobium sp. 9U]VWX49669.1 conserved hypothetical protein [Novosphingobium sp. 9U]
MSFDLDRFVAAQEGSYDVALAEITAGAKRSHWMWYIFPQVAGLGHSAMAQRYAIGSLAEAQAYLEHPLLGQRLRECAAALDGLSNTSAERVFGGIDALKLRSSLTLFEAAGAAFGSTIERWFGERDARTLEILSQA